MPGLNPIERRELRRLAPDEAPRFVEALEDSDYLVIMARPGSVMGSRSVELDAGEALDLIGVIAEWTRGFEWPEGSGVYSIPAPGWRERVASAARRFDGEIRRAPSWLVALAALGAVEFVPNVVEFAVRVVGWLS